MIEQSFSNPNSHFQVNSTQAGGRALEKKPIYHSQAGNKKFLED